MQVPTILSYQSPRASWQICYLISRSLSSLFHSYYFLESVKYITLPVYVVPREVGSFQKIVCWSQNEVQVVGDG